MLLAGALLCIAARPAGAQEGPTDPRWHAWLGCWTPATSQAATPAVGRAAEMVCVVPARAGSAVERVTIAGGEIMSRERIEANGVRRARERDGCTGWERAQWSSDARRVFLQSEDDCQNGRTQRREGLMALSLDGDWLDISAVTVGTSTVVRVLRYLPAGRTIAVPADIASAVQENAARAAAARIAARRPVITADIVEASRQLHPGVVEAWLADLGQPFAVNARRLVELTEAGMPDRVIDIMVALSYPRAFAIAPSTNAVGLLAGSPPRVSPSDRPSTVPSIWDCDLFLDDISRSWSIRELCLRTYYSRSGYFSYGRGLAYGGWYPANEPLVIVVSGSGGGGVAASPSTTVHGRVVNGRGYTQGTTSDQRVTGTSRDPASTTSDRGSSSPSGGSSSSASGQSSSASSSSASGSSGTSSGAGERTAHPR